MAEEANTVGAQHITAIPIFNSSGSRGTLSTKKTIIGVTSKIKRTPAIKCYDSTLLPILTIQYFIASFTELISSLSPDIMKIINTQN